MEFAYLFFFIVGSLAIIAWSIVGLIVLIENKKTSSLSNYKEERYAVLVDDNIVLRAILVSHNVKIPYGYDNDVEWDRVQKLSKRLREEGLLD